MSLLAIKKKKQIDTYYVSVSTVNEGDRNFGICDLKLFFDNLKIRRFLFLSKTSAEMSSSLFLDKSKTIKSVSPSKAFRSISLIAFFERLRYFSLVNPIF